MGLRVSEAAAPQVAAALIDGIADDEAWRRGLELLADWLHADHLVVALARPTGMAVWGGRVGEHHLQRVAEAATTLMQMSRAIPVGMAVAQQDIVDDDAFEHSGFFNDVVRPMGGFRAAVARPFDECVVVACRGSRKGIPAATVDRLQAILPTVATTVACKARASALSGRLRAMEVAFDDIETAVFVLDSARRVLQTNRRARQILACGDLVASPHGLEAASGHETDRLCEAFASANGEIVPVNRPSHRHPLFLRALRQAGPGDQHTILIAGDPAHLATQNLAGVCAAMALTPRESEIVALAADGLANDAIAARLGITIGNLRGRLKTAFHKLGVHSRAELVGLVRGAI